MNENYNNKMYDIINNLNQKYEKGLISNIEINN